MTAIYVLAFAGMVGAIVIGELLSKDRKGRQALRRAQVWPIGELPEDTLGRIVGHARALGEPLRAPLSGRACVYYEVTVTQQSGKSATTIIHEARGVPFAIEDGTGRAIVDPTLSHALLEIDHKTSSGTLDAPTAAERALLDRHDQASEGWIFNLALTYREGVIELDERITILGAGVREPDLATAMPEGYRGNPRTLLRMTSSKRHPLLISDAPKLTH